MLLAVLKDISLIGRWLAVWLAETWYYPGNAPRPSAGVWQTFPRAKSR